MAASVIFIVAAIAPTAGVPLWVTVLGIVLAGLAVPAFQYLTKLREAEAGSGVAESTARQIDSAVVDTVIIRLRGENQRLYERLDLIGVQLTDLQGEVKKRPTRDDLLQTVENLRTQLTDKGITPVNGPKPPSDAPKGVT